MNNNKKGFILIVIGLLFLCAALFLAGYNIWTGKEAQKQSIVIAEQLKSKILEEKQYVPNYELFPDVLMPVADIDGESYIGILEIPVLEIILPVMNEWSYPRLKIAPCRYMGSVYTKNMIVAAHNYDSHFGGIKTLIPGDVVWFTDTNGNIFGYEVVELEILNETDVERLEQGDWDLTLFTCTIGGADRVIIRCKEKV